MFSCPIKIEISIICLSADEIFFGRLSPTKFFTLKFRFSKNLSSPNCPAKNSLQIPCYLHVALFVRSSSVRSTHTVYSKRCSLSCYSPAVQSSLSMKRFSLIVSMSSNSFLNCFSIVVRQGLRTVKVLLINSDFLFRYSFSLGTNDL